MRGSRFQVQGSKRTAWVERSGAFGFPARRASRPAAPHAPTRRCAHYAFHTLPAASGNRARRSAPPAAFSRRPWPARSVEPPPGRTPRGPRAVPLLPGRAFARRSGLRPRRRERVGVRVTRFGSWPVACRSLSSRACRPRRAAAVLCATGCLPASAWRTGKHWRTSRQWHPARFHCHSDRGPQGPSGGISPRPCAVTPSAVEGPRRGRNLSPRAQSRGLAVAVRCHSEQAQRVEESRRGRNLSSRAQPRDLAVAVRCHSERAQRVEESRRGRTLSPRARRSRVEGPRRGLCRYAVRCHPERSRGVSPWPLCRSNDLAARFLDSGLRPSLEMTTSR